MTTQTTQAGNGAGAKGTRQTKYQELRQLLRVELSKLLPHDPLPSERELMATYGVSRMTVRQALRLLTDDGLVYRVHGSGTFVADPTTVVKSLRLTSFSEDISARRMTPGSRLLTHERLEADAGIAQDLNLPPGDPVLHLERLRTADGVPMCLENVWLPAALLPDLDDRVLGDSLYQLLDEAGSAPDRADQHIRATVLNTREAELLGVPPYSAALLMTRITYDTAGRAIERARGLYRADRYDVQVTVTRSGT
ncbi:GntR family transcriptional regulator [Kribbella italica]|uniref:GntR family transcriptional regulator n=1 Tax=Kribbella italica TaxID=1540520 RepID=A0A7W9J1A0_9ACTN|nr:GntR family transcriptional regulator [Kribbella italica]MBB5833305.1 GntR family transcriptional regulator [Kribbella italica]